MGVRNATARPISDKGASDDAKTGLFMHRGVS